jgi:hypothetical protein
MKNVKTSFIAKMLVVLIMAIYAMIAFSSCTTMPTTDHPSTVSVSPTPGPTPVPASTALPISEANPKFGYLPLSWEKNHPERAAWSKSLIAQVVDAWSQLREPKDMDRFCAKYSSLFTEQRIKVWAELFVAMAYYESGWNPKSASVDVGTKDDRDTWSIGLWQMSVIDQESYKLPLGYKYEHLLEPGPNGDLAVRIMARQIERRGTIVVSSSPYWAVIKEGGRYQKINQIAAMVSALPFCK